MKYYNQTHDSESKINHHGSSGWINIFVVLIMGLLSMQIVASNRLANLGTEMNRIETEIQQITTENTYLKRQIASESALLVLQQKAKEQGFTQTITPWYVSGDLPVALDWH